MEFLLDFPETWANVQARHALLVHAPIVLSLLCPIAVLLLAIRGGRDRGLRWTALLLSAALAVTAFVAKQSGEEAEEAVEGALSEAAEEVLEHHEELAEWVWVFGLVGFVLVGLSFGPHVLKSRGEFPSPASNHAKLADAVRIKIMERVAPWAMWIAAALSIFTAAWVANTAHHGGELVYEYGAVVPTEVEPLGVPSTQPGGDPRVAHFQSRVLPILKNICWKCHNPERKERAHDLDQTSIAGLLAGGESGPALVPGHPEKSLMIEVLSWEGEIQMPPKAPLEPEQIEAIRQWIADGAVWVLPERDTGGEEEDDD